MASYQFFCKPESERKEFTYLVMGTETFQEEKKQLLQLGFAVEDDVIHASSSEEAVEKFKSNYVYALDEYSNSYIAGGVATFIFETYKEVSKRLGKR
ncbi:hypothetical protein P3441_23010 [Vibrio parahaemolyticus]|nr:hypothetical protein [Vibrio parahaemolyticus]MDF4452915.1 hypothetical protein [Vibrio parahaemolyticus]